MINFYFFLVNNINKTSIQSICCCSVYGSSTDQGQGVGGGFVITNNTNQTNKTSSKNTHLNSKTTVLFFKQKLQPYTKKLSFSQLSDSKDRIITFWTDSMSALQALSNKLHHNKTVHNCHNTLNKLASNNKVYLRWIAAHAGHWGNEKADTLAKAGTSCDNLLKSYMPQTHIKTEINNKVKILDKAHWAKIKHKHLYSVLTVQTSLRP